MANYAITACAVFLMLELFAAGTAVMAKKAARKNGNSLSYPFTVLRCCKN